MKYKKKKIVRELSFFSSLQTAAAVTKGLDSIDLRCTHLRAAAYCSLSLSTYTSKSIPIYIVLSLTVSRVCYSDRSGRQHAQAMDGHSLQLWLRQRFDLRRRNILFGQRMETGTSRHLAAQPDTPFIHVVGVPTTVTMQRLSLFAPCACSLRRLSFTIMHLSLLYSSKGI